MKKKTKNKLLTASIFTCFGLISGMALAVNQDQQHYESAKAVYYDEDNYTITLEGAEKTYELTNFYSALVDVGTNEISLAYNGNEYDYNEGSDSDVLVYSYEFEPGSEEQIGFMLDYIDYDEALLPEHNYYFFNKDYADVLTYDLTIECGNSTRYGTLKNAIELDIQENAPTQSESIIGAISSGMGLVPDLANEFLTGFSAIFWDATNSKLTTASEFMLVMLGIAIVMAIIKLAMMLIRNNTGA